MFADLGHFSVPSIQIAFTCVVFPCLLLAYMGQAAYLMKYPDSTERIFYDSIPDGFFWPIFVLATIAAIIASQAMISASFSCVKQSMALGCFPRLKIVHTSRRKMGQIYIPVINWFLMIMCVMVVATFRSTTDIANAYGKLFPHHNIFKWMSYGSDGKHPACDRSYFGRREFSFNSASELENSINEKCPVKIDIGPVYNVDVRCVYFIFAPAKA